MEVFDPEAILAKRREAVRQTLRRIDAAEVRAFLDDLFVDRKSHPWFKPFHDFLDEHATDNFLRAEPEPGITIIYHPGARVGLWCRQGETLEGLGLMHGRGLDAMDTLASEFRSNPS
jgi:hypothetical protein